MPGHKEGSPAIALLGSLQQGINSTSLQQGINSTMPNVASPKLRKTFTWKDRVGLGTGRESILGKDIWEAGEDVVSREPTEKQTGYVGEKVRDRQGSDLEGGVHCVGTASHGRVACSDLSYVEGRMERLDTEGQCGSYYNNQGRHD